MMRLRISSSGLADLLGILQENGISLPLSAAFHLTAPWAVEDDNKACFTLIPYLPDYNQDEPVFLGSTEAPGDAKCIPPADVVAKIKEWQAGQQVAGDTKGIERKAAAQAEGESADPVGEMFDKAYRDMLNSEEDQSSAASVEQTDGNV